MKLEDPLFKYILSRNPLKINSHKILEDEFKFMQNATKIIMDADEYIDWLDLEDERQITFNEDSLLGSIPFSIIWIEVYTFKTGKPYALSFSNEPLIAGVGYDLKHKIMRYLTFKSDGNSLLLSCDLIELKNRTPNETEIAALRHLAFMSQFLQTEYVNAVCRTIKIGSKLKRGNIKSSFSTYLTIYRKQPDIKIVGKALEQQIEWQHRWKVRGHWRRIKGIGHDPIGNEIDGFTWVRECIKGPEDKPILDRPQIFKNKLPPKFIEITKE